MPKKKIPGWYPTPQWLLDEHNSGRHETVGSSACPICDPNIDSGKQDKCQE